MVSAMVSHCNLLTNLYRIIEYQCVYVHLDLNCQVSVHKFTYKYDM